MTEFVDASDFERLGALFDGAAERAGNPRPVLEAFGDYMVTESVPQNFRDKGRVPPNTAGIPTGRWPDAHRPLGGPVTSTPLVDTGEMRDSVSFAISEGDLFLRGGDGTMPKWRTHQEGRTIVPKNASALRVPMAGGKFARLQKVVVPARPPLVFQIADLQRFGLMYGAYVFDAAVSTGAL
jgi:hypothetical protein